MTLIIELRPRSLFQILAGFSGCCGEESRKKIGNSFKEVKNLALLLSFFSV
jgi:hypothetical protein